MGKKYAPRLIRKAKQELRSRLWSSRFDHYHEYDVEDRRKRREEAARDCNHESVEWLDRAIKDYEQSLSTRKQNLLSARSEYTRVRRLYTASKDTVTDVIEILIDAEDLENETEFKDRQSHRRGWGNAYAPTRHRYWRPAENNWKLHRKRRWREE
jgi:hypothetical protein